MKPPASFPAAYLIYLSFGQGNKKSAALSFPALCRYGPSVSLHNGLYNGKADTGPPRQ